MLFLLLLFCLCCLLSVLAMLFLKVWSCKGLEYSGLAGADSLCSLPVVCERRRSVDHDDGTAVSRWNTGEIRWTSNSNRPVLQQPFVSAFNFLFKEQLFWFRLRHSRPIWDRAVHCFDFENLFEFSAFWRNSKMTVNCKKTFLWYEKNWAFSIMSSQSIGWVAFAWFLSIHASERLIVLEDQSMNHPESFIQSGDFYLRTATNTAYLIVITQMQLHVEAFLQMPRPKFVESPKRTVLGWNTFSLVFGRCLAVVSNFWAPRPRGFEIFCVKLYPLIFRDCNKIHGNIYTYNKIHSKPLLRILVNQWFHGSWQFFCTWLGHETRPMLLGEDERMDKPW